MFVDLPQNLILMTVGAFLLGWILASISARLGSRYNARKRDPRDDRIRSLEAELRVAQTDAEELKETSVLLKNDLEQASEDIVKRDNVITDQMQRMESLKSDLRESVAKTRELRHELTDRAEENVRSEAKLREVETELSVAQASQDLLSTGVLDYSINADDGGEPDDRSEPADVSKTKTAT